MVRPISVLAPDRWDYTTLDRGILDEAGALREKDLEGLSCPDKGFEIRFHDTPEIFYSAEAMEYVSVWLQANDNNQVGICGPIGPTEQLPIVAQIINELGRAGVFTEEMRRNSHFAGMDEWYLAEEGRAAPVTHPLSFKKADLEMCFNRMDPKYRLPEENLHFPTDVEEYQKIWESGIRWLRMQGGQGEVKHWAFNDPPERKGDYVDEPQPVADYLDLRTRVVKLHPATCMQNARTSGGGMIHNVPTHAVTVGPYETWKCDEVSIWLPEAGHHDNELGLRLTALMIAKGRQGDKAYVDTSVPMSLLAEFPGYVVFNYMRGKLGTCDVEMH